MKSFDSLNDEGLTVDFALIGRHPLCGCPMAIDMDATVQAQGEFAEKGYLLEFLAPDLAKDLWSEASWPCPHFYSRGKG